MPVQVLVRALAIDPPAGLGVDDWTPTGRRYRFVVAVVVIVWAQPPRWVLLLQQLCPCSV